MGNGPGMAYATHVARHLERAEVECFSSLHVAIEKAATATEAEAGEASNEDRAMQAKVERADILLAIITPAFCSSDRCLQELTSAFNHGLTVVPIVFELTNGGRDDLWTVPRWAATFERLKSASASGEDQSRLERYQQTLKRLEKCSPHPTVPTTMLDEGSRLNAVVDRVKELLATRAPTGSSWLVHRMLESKQAEPSPNQDQSPAPPIKANHKRGFSFDFSDVSIALGSPVSSPSPSRPRSGSFADAFASGEVPSLASLIGGLGGERQPSGGAVAHL